MKLTVIKHEGYDDQPQLCFTNGTGKFGVISDLFASAKHWWLPIDIFTEIGYFISLGSPL